MSRPFDIVVYGATGFTGKRVAKYLVESQKSLKIALSGRNEEKLSLLANELGLPQESALVAPLDDHEKLTQTLADCRIVLACAGPYRHMGEEVIRAAIKAKTDYLDLCGEPQFFNDMLLKYDDDARANQVLVISACAFDCVPAELTSKLACKEFNSKYENAEVTNLEVVHTFQGLESGNATTFHAAVDGFHAGINGELAVSRKKVQEKLKIVKVPIPQAWPKIVSSPNLHPIFHEDTNSYLLKFVGADAACILASDRYLRYRSDVDKYSKYKDKPHPRLSLCFGCPTKSAAYKTLAYGGVFATLARYKWGCDLLHDKPELFTNGCFRDGGPTDEQLSKGSFKTYCTAYGMNKEQAAKVTCEGPEPGYVATPRMIVALAKTVLQNRAKIPFEGGVMLPGAAFGDCEEVYDMLEKEGVRFKVENGGYDDANNADNAV